MKHNFTNKLLAWYNNSARPLPWKNVKDPYLIWLSEIILQQTRVEQGLPYYERFKEAFPDVESLANASEDEVLKLWQGLGYYSRARNLHAAANMVMEDFEGYFPNNYQDIKSLKGVGDYTAAAIASFAYDQPYAVVDGNVYRVLSRYFGLDIPIDSTKGKKAFRELADEMLAQDEPATYNQAIMDFGATVCKPALPLCDACPLNDSCEALQTSRVNELPIKEKKVKQRDRYFHYLVIESREHIFLRKRVEKDIWQNLYEFPMIEHNSHMPIERLQETDEWKKWLGGKVEQTDYAGSYQQKLSHQLIKGVFYKVRVKEGLIPGGGDLIETNREKIDNFAFPKLVDCYLRDKTLYLNL